MRSWCFWIWGVDWGGFWGDDIISIVMRGGGGVMKGEGSRMEGRSQGRRGSQYGWWAFIRCQLDNVSCA